MLSFCPLAGAKKKALSGFLFYLLLVTLFSGPRHTGHGQHRRHRVDTHTRIKGLGRTLGGGRRGGIAGGGIVVIGVGGPDRGETICVTQRSIPILDLLAGVYFGRTIHFPALKRITGTR